MRITDLYNYLTTNLNGNNFTYYRNEFPSNPTDNCAVVVLTSGFAPSKWTHKKQPSFQVLIKSKKPPDAEAKAYEIFEHFHNKIEFTIGTTRIIHCSSDQSVPLFIGKDEEDRTIYSLNFTITTL